MCGYVDWFAHDFIVFLKQNRRSIGIVMNFSNVEQGYKNTVIDCQWLSMFQYHTDGTFWAEVMVIK